MNVTSPATMMPGIARNKKRQLLSLRLRVSELAASLCVMCAIAQRTRDHSQSLSFWSTYGLESCDLRRSLSSKSTRRVGSFSNPELGAVIRARVWPPCCRRARTLEVVRGLNPKLALQESVLASAMIFFGKVSCRKCFVFLMVWNHNFADVLSPVMAAVGRLTVKCLWKIGAGWPPRWHGLRARGPIPIVPIPLRIHAHWFSHRLEPRHFPTPRRDHVAHPSRVAVSPRQ